VAQLVCCLSGGFGGGCLAVSSLLCHWLQQPLSVVFPADCLDVELDHRVRLLTTHSAKCWGLMEMTIFEVSLVLQAIFRGKLEGYRGRDL